MTKSVGKRVTDTDRQQRGPEVVQRTGLVHCRTTDERKRVTRVNINWPTHETASQAYQFDVSLQIC